MKARAERSARAFRVPAAVRPGSQLDDRAAGHAEAFAIGDVVARYHRLNGYDVLHPIGWDSFGLPAENAAIRRDAHPAERTCANIETQAESFRRYGLASGSKAATIP